jgi:hypothetical protein
MMKLNMLFAIKIGIPITTNHHDFGEFPRYTPYEFHSSLYILTRYFAKVAPAGI